MTCKEKNAPTFMQVIRRDQRRLQVLYMYIGTKSRAQPPYSYAWPAHDVRTHSAGARECLGTGCGLDFGATRGGKTQCISVASAPTRLSRPES